VEILLSFDSHIFSVAPAETRTAAGKGANRDAIHPKKNFIAVAAPF
jgi:hypothetical protein